MSATPRTDALEKAVSLGMVGSQLFAEVRKVEKDLEAMTEGLKIASVAVENLRHEVNAHRNAAMEADLRTQAAVRSEKKALAEKVNLSEMRRVMTEWHQRAVALGFDGVPDLIASIEAGRAMQ